LKLLIPLLASILLMKPEVMSTCLQYTACWLIMLIELAVITNAKGLYVKGHMPWIYHFAVAGAMTSYVDFLTFPLVTFAIPFMFCVGLYPASFRAGLKRLIGCGSAWAVGYAGMWIGKWIIASVATGNNVFAEARQAATFRTSNSFGGESLSWWGTALKNITQNMDSLMLAVIPVVVVLLVFIVNKDLVRLNRNVLLYVAVALLPFVWYGVLLNHSYIHSWFTFRDISITICAMYMIALNIIQSKSIGEAGYEGTIQKTY